jgi:tRNA C32,U32 (ribose-2'-O)-methylase TrmJ
MSTVTIQLSQHAVERFQQRVRPALSLLDAERELAQLALAGELIPEPPAWHAATCAQIAEWYLVIADVVLPLKQHWSDRDVLVATTCLARGERSAEARHRRRQRRGTTSQPRRRSLMGRP